MGKEKRKNKKKKHMLIYIILTILCVVFTLLAVDFFQYKKEVENQNMWENEVEKAILLYLMSFKDPMGANRSVLYEEKLESKYEREQIIDAARNLKKKNIIELHEAINPNGNVGGASGKIATNKAFSSLKKLFRYRLWYHFKNFINNNKSIFASSGFFMDIVKGIIITVIGGMIIWKLTIIKKNKTETKQQINKPEQKTQLIIEKKIPEEQVCSKNQK